MSTIKNLVVELESVDKTEQLTGVEGSVTATVEIQIDIDMDRDELDAAGILEQLEDNEDLETVVQYIQNNIHDYDSEIQDAVDEAEVEDSSLDVYRDDNGKWPDLDKGSVYLFQLNDGSMTIETGGALGDDGGPNIEAIWLISSKCATEVDTTKTEPAKVCSVCNKDLEADNTVLYCTQCVRDESSDGDETPELARE